MQWWVVTGAWAFAVLFAVVLLGFAGYELAWKARRLATDRARLDRTVTDLTEIAGQLGAAADRAAGLRPVGAPARAAGLRPFDAPVTDPSEPTVR